MVIGKATICFLVAGLLLCLADSDYAMCRPQTGPVLMLFVHAWNKDPIPFDHIRSVTLIRYERQEQDEGVSIKRWAGDTSSRYKYVEKEKRKLNLNDFPKGLISLEPGIYQFKHNSVYGQPPVGYYGKSNFFEIKAGEETIDVQILLTPAI